MKHSKADLILHPVRMRIIMALAGGNAKTASELVQWLSDVPQATLYRHLNTLLKGKIITVVEERPVRGTIEKVYALPEGAGSIPADELARANKEDHMRYFTTFIAALLDDFARYLKQDSIDLHTDGVGYRQVPLWLTEEEFALFTQEIRAVVGKAVQNHSTPGRKLRKLTTIIVPEPLHEQSKERKEPND